VQMHVISMPCTQVAAVSHLQRAPSQAACASNLTQPNLDFLRPDRCCCSLTSQKTGSNHVGTGVFLPDHGAPFAVKAQLDSNEEGDLFFEDEGSMDIHMLQVCSCDIL